MNSLVGVMAVLSVEQYSMGINPACAAGKHNSNPKKSMAHEWTILFIVMEAMALVVGDGQLLDMETSASRVVMTPVLDFSKATSADRPLHKDLI